MASTQALRLLTAGLVASVIVWSLIPAATGMLTGTECVEVPGGAGAGGPLALQARTEATQQGWIPAAGQVLNNGRQPVSGEPAE